MSTIRRAPQKTNFALILLISILLTSNILSAAMLDSLDRAILDSALILLNIRPSELGFDKMWVEDDTFRLAVVERYLDDPYAFPDYVDETQAVIDSFAREPLALLQFIADQLKVDPATESLELPRGLNLQYDPANPFGLWLEAIEKAEPMRKTFYAGLDSLDIHDLIMAAPGLWNESEDSVKSALAGAWQREFDMPVDTSRDVDGDVLLDDIKKLDMNALLSAAMVTAPAAQALARGFAVQGIEIPNDFYEINGVRGKVLYHEETEWGTFVIGSGEDNIYTGDFAAILDMGGDDVYRGRYGGAMGELGHPYALVVDLEGDDYYDAEGMDVSFGSGFLGIGILIDRGGNDTYRSGNYSQGSGFFGVGILVDHGGADDRRGGYFMQGSGHCGVGILLDEGDESSDDRYLSSCWAQGFASTFGYGMLFDDGGDDTYRAGGTFYHAPLLPNDYRSFSGGFGMGWRPRAGGGIGVLYDKGSGNDFYDAEVMSFGSSYWYSIGILIDGGGNDSYNLAHYGLGVGIHLSLGALYEMDGDDQFHSRHGVVGATAHDLSVGLMVDGGGDDYYIVGDGWGGSLTNSYGLFIDRLGNDTYATRGSGYSLGNARWARGFAGAAIFLDLEGNDVYPGGEIARDSTIWIRSGWGIGIDLPRDVPTEKEEEIGEITLTAEDSAKSVEELFREASQWEVGSARESVKRARQALLTKGSEAVQYIIDNKLNTRSSLESRLLDQVVTAMPDTAGPMLVAKLPETAKEKDPRYLINTVSLLGTIKWKDAVDPLLDMLDEKSAEKARNSIISALGKIGDAAAAQPVCRYIDDEMEKRRIFVLGSLRSFKDTLTIPDAVNRFDDELFTVRSAAMLTVAAYGIPAIPHLLKYLEDDASRHPESALYTIGRIARDIADSADTESKNARWEAAQILEDYLESANPFLRSEAVTGLYRIGGDETRRMVDRCMEHEYNPVVNAAWQRVKRELKD